MSTTARAPGIASSNRMGRPRPPDRRAALVTTPAATLSALLAALVLLAGPAAGPPSAPAGAAHAATTFPLRLEAGPQRAVRYDAAWRVAASTTVTYAAPVTTTGSARVYVAGRGAWIRVAGAGSLAGWWVPESRVAYRPGVVGSTALVPARRVTLAAGAWELYRFTSTGAVERAAGRRLATAVTELADRTAVVNGRRHTRLASGPWSGWWLPGAADLPIPITCSAGGPPAGTAGRIVRSVPTATGELALTFDMGGRLDPALAIVRHLVLERVCATIFPTGLAASTTTGRAVLAEIRAHPELFEVGNHTVHHCNLRDGGGGSACPATRPSAAFVTAELARADAIVAPLAGRRTIPYWRPPYGAVDAALVTVAAAAGYPYTVLWSTDTIDWRPVANGGPTAARIAAVAVAGRRAGGIVLMHLGGWNTRNALPAIVEGLRGAGYDPTTLSDLWRP